MEDKTVNQINDNISKLESFDKDKLINRPEWGEVNFERCRPIVTSIFKIIEEAKNLPLELIPKAFRVSFRNDLTNTISIFERMNVFSLSKEQNPADSANRISGDLENNYKGIIGVGGVYFPLIREISGDEHKLSESEEILSSIKAQKSEVDGIVSALKNLSSEHGVAVYHEEFARESVNNFEEAKSWLVAAGISLFVTLLFIGFVYIDLNYGYSNIKKIDLMFAQVFAVRVFLFLILITCTIWFGRMYKNLKNLGTINKHRALSLKTFKTFVTSTENSQIKDAVLLETTRAIFSHISSGFIDNNDTSSESNFKIFETVKNINKDG